MRSPFVGAVVAAALLTILASCGGTGSRPDAVVLITLDTTRADRLGCYGHDRAETPNLDRFASEAVRFDQASATVPVTLPSHASMFTGLNPPVHGIRYNGMYRLREESVTVAELLQERGWRTAGMPAAFPLNAQTGIGQGFEVYRDMFAEEDPASLAIHSERRAEEISDLGIEWLEGRGDEPFFLWLHYFDAHYPYEPPFPFSARFRDRPYDGEIAYMDSHVGRVLDWLRTSGRWDRTVVIVAGDHGEGLYDHGEKMHANLVYESTIRVPLLVRMPGGKAGSTVASPVSVTDVGPTILEAAGVPIPEWMEGRSLLPAATVDGPDDRVIYFETLAGSLVYGWSALEGVRRGNLKYTRSTTPELFDLEADPGETRNLHDERPEIAAELDGILSDLQTRWELLDSGAAIADTPLDDSMLARLAALGYVGGAVTEQAERGPDPRRLVHFENDVFTARDATREGEFGFALEIWKRILAADPGNRHALHQAAQVSARMEDWDAALDYTARAVERYPDFIAARLLRGHIFVRLNRLRDAAAEFEAGLEYAPGDSGLVYRHAIALYATGRVQEALAAVERFLEDHPDYTGFWVHKAACLAKLDRPDEAREALSEAIDRGYGEIEILRDEPLLEPLRAVPGFDEIVSRIAEEPRL